MAFWNNKETDEQAAQKQTSPNDPPTPVPQQPVPAPPSQDQAQVSAPPAIQPATPQTPAMNTPKDTAVSDLNQAVPAEPAGQSAQVEPPVQMLTTPLAGSLGKVISVLMFARRFQDMTLRDVRVVVLPAVTANQYLVAEARAKDSDVTTPLGVLLWARLSDELDQKLIAQNGARSLLSGDEWKSGPNLWIIETVGSPKIIKAMVHQLIEGPFKGQHFKFCTRSSDGTASVEEFDPASISG